MWIWIIIIAIIIGAIWGASSSNDGMGCGYILFQIFIFGAGIIFVLWLFSKLFG